MTEWETFELLNKIPIIYHLSRLMKSVIFKENPHGEAYLS